MDRPRQLTGAICNNLQWQRMENEMRKSFLLALIHAGRTADCRRHHRHSGGHRLPQLPQLHNPNTALGRAHCAYAGGQPAGKILHRVQLVRLHPVRREPHVRHERGQVTLTAYLKYSTYHTGSLARKALRHHAGNAGRQPAPSAPVTFSRLRQHGHGRHRPSGQRRKLQDHVNRGKNLGQGE